MKDGIATPRDKKDDTDFSLLQYTGAFDYSDWNHDLSEDMDTSSYY